MARLSPVRCFAAPLARGLETVTVFAADITIGTASSQGYWRGGFKRLHRWGRTWGARDPVNSHRLCTKRGVKSLSLCLWRPRACSAQCFSVTRFQGCGVRVLATSISARQITADAAPDVLSCAASRRPQSHALVLAVLARGHCTLVGATRTRKREALKARVLRVLHRAPHSAMPHPHQSVTGSMQSRMRRISRSRRGRSRLSHHRDASLPLALWPRVSAPASSLRSHSRLQCDGAI